MPEGFNLNRPSLKPDGNDPARDDRGDRIGLAPVFAAALGAACCLAVPVLVGLFAGGSAAAAWSGGTGLLSLFIIGFALGGVLVVVLHYVRASRRAANESAQNGARRRGESESDR